MVKFFFIALLVCFSSSSFAWYYHSIPGVISGISSDGTNIHVAGNVWLCSTKASSRDLILHVYGISQRDINIPATLVNKNTSTPVGVPPSLFDCQNATDEPDRRIKVAHYRITSPVIIPVLAGDYNACWSGWDGFGNNSLCLSGLPITPINDCQTTIVQYPNDLGTITVGDKVNRTAKVADITLQCKTVNAITVLVEQKVTPGNVLKQEIRNSAGKRLEGLVVLKSKVATPIFMHSSGVANVAQNIRDTVVIVFNYQ